MDHSVLLVGNDLVQLYILNAAEDIHNNLRISLVKVGDELLYLLALGTRGAVRIAGRAGIREPARALNEMQIVVLCPVLYFVLAYEVHRADKLHSREICTVELRHHGLHLTAVDHAHEYGLDNVVKVMTQRYLIAAEFLRLVAIAFSEKDIRFLPAEEIFAWTRYFEECTSFVVGRIRNRRIAEGKDPDGADDWKKGSVT